MSRLRAGAAALALAASLLAATAPARGATRVVVEVDPRVELYLDARVTRRLVNLEAGEVEIGLGAARRRAALFFRVLPARVAGSLRVELWDRGEFHGARTVAGQGSRAELLARRVALAAAELAESLRVKRDLEARASERARAAAAEEQRAPEARDVTLLAGARAALVGPGALALVGPELGTRLRLRGRLRLEASLAGLAGTAADLSPDSGARWLELAVVPLYAVPLSPRFTFDVGPVVGVAAVHLSAVQRVDDLVGSHDTWSSRAGAHLAINGPLAGSLRFTLGAELGALLRPVPVIDGSGAGERLGGPWLGLGLRVLAPL